MNPLKLLALYGQSVWLDDISRGLVSSGRLKRLIEEDGIEGVTSNPTIFERAIGSGREYEDDIRAMALADRDVEEICLALTLQDVRSAADELWSLYDATGGRAGFVSLEVDPRIARQTEPTIREARRLWRALDRPNVLIKVPATREGVPAIRQLIREGVNVNVTLIFGLSRYREVGEAYLAGLEERAAAGEDLASVRSVASFFLSRIDVLVDSLLEGDRDPAGAGRELRGEAALASAKLAYQIYREMVGAARWSALAGRGARPQRLLWASTRSKNPEDGDLKYFEPLIGADTVITATPETIQAYRDHGRPKSRIGAGLGWARRVFRRLSEAGIQMEAVTQELEDEGLRRFADSYEKLIKTLQQRVAPFRQELAEREQLQLS